MGKGRKPNKGLLKRIRVSKKGKVKIRRAGLGHLCSHKSSKRKRKLRRIAVLHPCNSDRVRFMLGQK
ncbi:MAG: 50S ribosomal protein L35 [Planctomycetota bacterium]|nr:MAG: 50S ribosomal protein L35 [Planctomycetota bacterium]